LTGRPAVWYSWPRPLCLGLAQGWATHGHGGHLGPMPPLHHLPGLYEPFSALSHLIGAALFAWLGALLLRRGRGDPLRVALLAVYAGSCVLLLTASGAYHMTARGSVASRVLARLDHAAIFVLIAGTFTPVHGLLFRGWLRWGPLAVVWSLAAAGIALKTLFFSDLPEWAGLSAYLGLGWLGALTGLLLWVRHGLAFVRPLLAGGLAYSAGAILEYHRWPVLIPGVVHGHEVFHLAVLAGALSQWLFVWRIAAGGLGAAAGRPRSEQAARGGAWPAWGAGRGRAGARRPGESAAGVTEVLR